MKCSCLNKYDKNKNIEKEFLTIREECISLNSILLPDETVPLFRKHLSTQIYSPFGKSIILKSYQEGYLHKITMPLHRFLTPKLDKIEKNYLKDLSEKWMDKSDLVEQNIAFKRYMGKLIEIIFAFWLEKKKWKVVELAATGCMFDIIAQYDNIFYDFEIKYLGIEDSVFESFIVSYKGIRNVFTFPYKDAYNFLLYKVYTGAKQLNKSSNGIVIIVIDDIASNLFSAELINRWISWENPKFLNNSSKKWDDFISNKRKKNPEIEQELYFYIKKLSEIWFVINSSNFDLKLYNKIYISNIFK